ncbi:MAG: lysine-sensitive aspartokinase 3, partial [Glaciecola sp.]
MTTTLNVAKFGGTSVANYETMCSCAKIIANNPNTRVVVVSAAAGVANHLVALANTPLTSVQIDDIVQKITDIELAIVNRLKHPEDVQ